MTGLDRAALLADASLSGRAFCRSHAELIDGWVRSIATDTLRDDSRLALIAIGGYGRSELSPQSDLDLFLVHEPGVDAAPVASRIWYPIWDAGLKLGHHVATIDQALALARDEIETATTLLDVRLLAGSAALADKLAVAAREQWKKDRKRRLVELGDLVETRHQDFGEVAFLLEPDLKQGRGGLRDVHALAWAEVAEPGLLEVSAEGLQSCYDVLLAARVELHRLVGRPVERLGLDTQDDVARRAGYADADALMADLASAARQIAWVSDSTWHQVAAMRGGGRRRPRSRRQSVGAGIVIDDGTALLTDAAPVGDSLLPLRLAAEAARAGAYIDHASLARLAEATPPLSDPWPPEARDLLVQLLGYGRAAISAVEALDQMGLFVRVLPEWEPCRSRPQRNAYHRFTVDRHLLEAASEATRLMPQVDRPDLLLLGTLLHDIGKGYPGDHTEVGMELVATIGFRMGLPAPDVDTLVRLVQHHLLLPDAATRRDLDDPGTIRAVVEQARSVSTLLLLDALTEADSIATGPAAWGSWKAGLVKTLVARAAHVLGGGSVLEVVNEGFPSVEHRALAAAGELAIKPGADQLLVVAPDRQGLFSRVAGVLALNGLDIVDAAVSSEDHMAVELFRVASPSAREISWDKVETDLRLALDGRLALSARLAERARTYGRRRAQAAKPIEPSVTVDNATSDHATVIEVVCPDGVGVLYRITRALAEVGLDVVTARVQTLGGDVVDAFYVRDSHGDKITDPDYLAEIDRAILHSLTAVS